MKRDYEKNENNEINEKPQFFSYISVFRFFRNLSPFLNDNNWGRYLYESSINDSVVYMHLGINGIGDSDQ
jgi:hypothetical protein